ncbi:hypothetical protein TNCT_313641 [Trichonephila clavata]|uniref:Uncharacterized protein n=1 Tax=Trichonephila clavata TaxID=2740835 RepID=A0A8X6EY97_TRICU|nr:hypothetical protein TNCT_313641 [Trichonephila clavata]
MHSPLPTGMTPKSNKQTSNKNPFHTTTNTKCELREPKPLTHIPNNPNQFSRAFTIFTSCSFLINLTTPFRKLISKSYTSNKQQHKHSNRTVLATPAELQPHSFTLTPLPEKRLLEGKRARHEVHPLSSWHCYSTHLYPWSKS